MVVQSETDEVSYVMNVYLCILYVHGFNLSR
jgi:hypothetical protein